MFHFIIALVLIACTVIASLYIYLTWHFGHWTKRKIPGPKPQALFGTFPGTVNGSRNFIYDLNEVYRKYRKVTRFVGVFMTRNPQLLILDPELCKEILISNFKNFQDNESSQWMDRQKEPVSGNNPFVLPSADWKVKRAEIVPGLTMAKVKTMFPIIENICSKLVNYVKEKLDQGHTTIDGKQLALCFTGEVVADVVWGIDAENFKDPLEDLQQPKSTFLKMSQQMIAQTFKAFKYFFIMGIFPFIRHMIYVHFYPEITDRFFMNLTRSALQARNSVPNSLRHDFLQYMLELQRARGLNETQILAHMLTFHFDGFETSATLISHCLLLLARYPEKQAKLRYEIQEYMSRSDNVLEFDVLMKLPYLNQCIAETLRIFTPLPFMSKICTRPYKLENNDGVCLDLQPGDVCLISLHSMHHDEEYYSQPEEFIPERFAEENGGTKKFKDMGVYMPFGDGPRICIGMTFALAQSKAAIVNIIQNFQLTVNERTRKDNIQSANGFITGLDGGIYLDFKEL